MAIEQQARAACQSPWLRRASCTRQRPARELAATRCGRPGGHRHWRLILMEPVAEVVAASGSESMSVAGQQPAAPGSGRPWAVLPPRRTGVPCCCYPGPGHPAAAISVLFAVQPSKAIGQLARDRARQVESRVSPLESAASPALSADAAHFAEVPFGGRLPVAGSAPSRARNLRRSFHQGRWLAQRPAAAASLGRASSSWRFRSAVSGSCSRPVANQMAATTRPWLHRHSPLESPPASRPPEGQRIKRCSR